MLVIRKVDWSIFRNHYLFLKTGISHLTYFLTQLITIKIMSSLIINSKHRQRNRWSNNENISDRTISYHYNDVSNSLQLIWHLICYWSFTVLITVWRISTDNVELDTVRLHFIKHSPLSSPVNMPLLQEKVQWKHLFMFTLICYLLLYSFFRCSLSAIIWGESGVLVWFEEAHQICLTCFMEVFVFICFYLTSVFSITVVWYLKNEDAFSWF